MLILRKMPVLKRFILIIMLFSLPQMALAAFRLPKQLDSEDRKSVLRILGFGSQTKLLSSPVPLGGREGFEFGLSSEYIPIGDLAGLGDQPDVKGEHNILNLGFGKGLYHNVDVLFSFTPSPQSEQIFGYGAHLRWGFHEFSRFPAVLSLVMHGNGMNFANLLSTRTTGADVIMTVAMDESALFFGGGTIRTIGTFMGGADGITLDQKTAEEDMTGFHTVFGFSLRFERIELTLEVDRVVQSTYGARLGYRF